MRTNYHRFLILIKQNSFGFALFLHAYSHSSLFTTTFKNNLFLSSFQWTQHTNLVFHDLYDVDKQWKSRVELLEISWAFVSTLLEFIMSWSVKKFKVQHACFWFYLYFYFYLKSGDMSCDIFQISFIKFGSLKSQLYILFF